MEDKAMGVSKNAPKLAVVLRWWKSMTLSVSDLNKEHIPRASSGTKAKLKRCDSVDAVVLTEGFRQLWFELPECYTAAASHDEIECWAVIASALAFVKTDTGKSLATTAGSLGDGGKPVVSETRFAQLYEAKTVDEFSRRLRRVLQQIKGETSVEKLASDIQRWCAENKEMDQLKAKDRISFHWAMQYYKAASEQTK